MPKVFIADALSPRAVEVFRERGIAVEMEAGLAPVALRSRIAGFDGLAVRSATKITRELLATADSLKVIGRAGIGVDNIDVEAATERGIVVMNTPYGNATTAAEHTIAMMFALARQIPAADRSTQDGKWEKSRFMGVELNGKTLGIIGCGNIGAIVAGCAQGLRMRVIAYDPYLSHERARELGIEPVPLEALLARADFITLHTPLTEATKGIIDAAALAKTKRGVRIVNCARGGLVIEADLAAALDSGQVGGAAADVFTEEPARENPLFGRDNVVVTPHLGAATTEAQENVAVQIAEQMADYLTSGAVANAVNMPSLSAEQAARLKPYMRLAEQIGSFAGQLTERRIRAVTLEYEGAVAEFDVKPLTAVALTGLLRPQLNTVNMVNAPLICRQRDIRVSETRRAEAGEYQTLMRIVVATEERDLAVAGTMFAGDKPRIVEVEGIPLEAELGRHVLIVYNDDKPGLIGAVGCALAAASINIATLHLGRTGPGENAIAIANLDQPLRPEALETVRALPSVIRAKTMHF